MLKQQIEEQLKEALKARDQITLSTLRLLLSDIKNSEIAKQKEATDEDVIAVAAKQVKQHKESIELYKKAVRDDLVAKEEQELAVLNKFLPQQKSEEEIKTTVIELLSQMSEEDKNNFGKVMGMVMAKLKGQADGNLVSAAVKAVLAEKTNQ